MKKLKVSELPAGAANPDGQRRPAALTAPSADAARRLRGVQTKLIRLSQGSDIKSSNYCSKKYGHKAHVVAGTSLIKKSLLCLQNYFKIEENVFLTGKTSETGGRGGETAR